SPPDWPLQIAADPVPEESATWQQRAAWTAVHGPTVSAVTAEKVVLVGLVGVIFGEVLPGLDVSPLQLFLGLSLFVVLNALIAMGVARASRGTDHAVVAFASRIVVNVVFVATARAVLGGDRMDGRAALFFVVMLSVLTLLHDRYQP